MKENTIYASKQTIESLNRYLGDYIREDAPLLNMNMGALEELEIMPSNASIKVVKPLLELNNFVNYVGIELASIARACLNSELVAEHRYNLKLINIVILEAFKSLHGFSKGSNKAIWNKSIKPLLSNIEGEVFQKEIAHLSQRLVDFGKSEFIDKDGRDLSLHYDLDPVLVYNHLVQIDEDKEFNNLIEFLTLMKEVGLFSVKYIAQYRGDVGWSGLSKYSFTLMDFDPLSNFGQSFFNDLGDSIQSYTQTLSRCVHHQSLPEKIREVFKKDDHENNSLQIAVDLEKAVMQCFFIYIDLGSALRATHTGTHTIEKQFALKQVNTIIYEGFKKLYGFDDECPENFWKQFILPYSGLVLKDFDEFESLKLELANLRGLVLQNSFQRQNSVHFNKGILTVYRILIEISPTIELVKAQRLLSVLPKIINFLTGILKVLSQREIEEQEEFDKKWREKFRVLVETIRKTTKGAEIEELIGPLEDFSVKKFFGRE